MADASEYIARRHTFDQASILEAKSNIPKKTGARSQDFETHAHLRNDGCHKFIILGFAFEYVIFGLGGRGAMMQ